MTLGLYNCYDPKQWHDIMRITLARAAPVAVAFDCDLATFGFPYEQARARGAKRNDLKLDSPARIAEFVGGSTTIGEGGDYLSKLVEQGRFSFHPFLPRSGAWPAKGRVVATTPTPQQDRALTPLQLAEDLAKGEGQLLVFGLGPRGLPDDVLAAAPRHLEITGQGISMETSTALGALPAMVQAHLAHLPRPAAAPRTVKA